MGDGFEKVTISGQDYKLEPTGPVRPEHIQEQFWDAQKGTVKVDELAKSYNELRKSYSQPKPNVETPAPQGNPLKPGNELGLPKASPNAPGIFNNDNMTKWGQEWQAQGQLSPESYEQLDKAGIPRPIVDLWARNMQVAQQAEYQSAFALVGGQGEYQQMAQWASDNLSPQEKKAYEKIVNGPDIAARDNAINGLYARYTEASGKPAARHLAGEPGGPPKNAFRSMDEMYHAMRDPRYESDETYRKEVQARVMAMK